MDSRALRHPVGPEPAHVYWTRRLVLLAVLVVVVVVAAYACSGGGSGSHPVRTGASGPGPTPTPTKQPVGRCDGSALTVTASTDAESYAAGSEPRLAAVVRNVAALPCRVDSQPAARVCRIRSGSDTVWSTGDCGHSENPALRRLGPGKQVTYAVVWDRHRSVDGCASPGAEAQPGTYRLYVSVDGVRSDAAVFHLTD